MNDTEIDCSLCGENLTDKTITEITKHLKEKHNITLMDALSTALKDTLTNIWEIEK